MNKNIWHTHTQCILNLSTSRGLSPQSTKSLAALSTKVLKAKHTRAIRILLPKRVQLILMKTTISSDETPDRLVPNGYDPRNTKLCIRKTQEGSLLPIPNPSPVRLRRVPRVLRARVPRVLRTRVPRVLRNQRRG